MNVHEKSGIRQIYKKYAHNFLHRAIQINFRIINQTGQCRTKSKLNLTYYLIKFMSMICQIFQNYLQPFTKEHLNRISLGKKL